MPIVFDILFAVCATSLQKAEFIIITSDLKTVKIGRKRKTLKSTAIGSSATRDRCARHTLACEIQHEHYN